MNDAIRIDYRPLYVSTTHSLCVSIPIRNKIDYDFRQHSTEKYHHTQSYTSQTQQKSNVENNNRRKKKNKIDNIAAYILIF